ncbi:MAG: cupin, partial [Solirubrobacteraceae bacterium]
PRGAHKTTNRGDATARLLMFSSAREPAVAVYPDSDKLGVWTGNEADQVILHRRDGAVDYYQGEG